MSEDIHSGLIQDIRDLDPISLSAAPGDGTDSSDRRVSDTDGTDNADTDGTDGEEEDTDGTDSGGDGTDGVDDGADTDGTDNA